MSRLKQHDKKFSGRWLRSSIAIDTHFGAVYRYQRLFVHKRRAILEDRGKRGDMTWGFSDGFSAFQEACAP